ncbi:MAG: hypothetical protein ABWJ97_07785 [Thermoproteus sp.]
MSWSERFVEDAERLFGISKEELTKFVDIMSRGDERGVEEWAERNGVEEKDFLVLSTMYVLYKAEDRVSEVLEGLELKVDEAVALIGSLTAQLINGMELENKKILLAQILLAAALQIEDGEIRKKMAELASTFIS